MSESACAWPLLETPCLIRSESGVVGAVEASVGELRRLNNGVNCDSLPSDDNGDCDPPLEKPIVPNPKSSVI